MTFGATGAVSAATVVVSTSNDPGPRSFRAAIATDDASVTHVVFLPNINPGEGITYGVPGAAAGTSRIALNNLTVRDNDGYGVWIDNPVFTPGKSSMWIPTSVPCNVRTTIANDALPAALEMALKGDSGT